MHESLGSALVGIWRCLKKKSKCDFVFDRNFEVSWTLYRKDLRSKSGAAR